MAPVPGKKSIVWTSDEVNDLVEEVHDLLFSSPDLKFSVAVGLAQSRVLQPHRHRIGVEQTHVHKKVLARYTELYGQSNAPAKIVTEQAAMEAVTAPIPFDATATEVGTPASLVEPPEEPSPPHPAPFQFVPTVAPSDEPVPPPVQVKTEMDTMENLLVAILTRVAHRVLADKDIAAALQLIAHPPVVVKHGWEPPQIVPFKTPAAPPIINEASLGLRKVLVCGLEQQKHSPLTDHCEGKLMLKYWNGHPASLNEKLDWADIVLTTEDCVKELIGMGTAPRKQPIVIPENITMLKKGIEDFFRKPY